jgi:anaerobic ribonucleoside-triphosphate reductase activating protein
LLSPQGGHEVDLNAVTERILACRGVEPALEGISVLGGEPLDQADGVSELCEWCRAEGLSTMVYTGYEYETLDQTHAGVRRLLEFIDVLVDGPFQQANYDESLAWRGSTNQRLLCLSSRYTQSELERRFSEQSKAFSIQMDSFGTISVSGLQVRRPALALLSSLRPRYTRRV